MNKQAAYEAMLNGYTVRNEYYSPEEFCFLNNKGRLEFENGVSQTHDEWFKWQDPEGTYEWEVIGDADKVLHANPDYSPADLPISYLHNNRMYEPSMLLGGTKKQRAEVVTPVRARSLINRNDPCMCGSGLKYKKCKCYVL